MEFLTNADLLTVIDQDTLDVLTDQDITKLTEAEARGIEEMIAYLSIRYNTDTIFGGPNKSTLIKMYLADIVLYHLHTRVSPDNIPELRVERYKNANNWLEKVADGFISPNLPTKAESEKLPIRFGSSVEKTDHYY